MPAKALLSQILLRRAWDHSASDAIRPWPWARTWPIARLRVSRLGIDEIVLAGTEGASLAFAPGHADGSAAPEEDGNIVIAGHRDTVFAFLSELRRGDNLVLETRSGRTRIFTVSDTEIIDQNDTVCLESSPKSMLTLVTCYPFDAVRPGGPLRYIVRALLTKEFRKTDARQPCPVPTNRSAQSRFAMLQSWQNNTESNRLSRSHGSFAQNTVEASPTCIR